MVLFLRTALVLFSCLLAVGCAGAVKTFSGLSKLHAAIVKEYGEETVGVNLTNKALTITFINSPLNTTDPVLRAERARQTAKFVSEHYQPIKEIDGIWVGFLKQETHYVIFHESWSLGFYGFDSSGTPLPGARPPEDSKQYSTAIYSETLKQTDIVLRSLQLEGDPDNGLSVFPHFTVPGEVTAADPSSTYPKEVRFDFSSTSEKSLFPGAPKITFLADDKVVYETTEQFSTSKFEDKFSEYLSLPVPYPVFLQMTNGRRLTMRIGDKEYPFSREHHDALLEMRAYVKEK